MRFRPASDAAGKLLVGICLVLLTASVSAAASASLNSVQFPEQRTVALDLKPSSVAPQARLEAKVTHRGGQSRIELSFADMKPAVLFSGDVTAYVLWAVTRDGDAENLGELVVREPKGEVLFSTGRKSFALLLTAEPYYLVAEPSALVMFDNEPSKDKKAPSTEFRFDGLAPAPQHAMTSIAHIRWDSAVPIDLLQAEKAYELAERHGAQLHASQVFAESGQALEQARKLARKDKKMLDYARRSVALSNVAINITRHTLEAAALEESLAQRRAEMATLEKRAAEAETNAQQAQAAVTESLRQQENARRDLLQIDRDRQQLSAETLSLRQEKAASEAAVEALKAEKLSLAREKSELSGRLQDALSRVAHTEQSARGFVVNLPDILFDLNQATLKPDAKVVIGKLAGILLLMPELSLQVEGHTDSTGSAAYNQQLSERRAEGVLTFLREQGIGIARMQSAGWGMDKPIAGNDSDEGRRKNRRVEIVISESR